MIIIRDQSWLYGYTLLWNGVQKLGSGAGQGGWSGISMGYSHYAE